MSENKGHGNKSPNYPELDQEGSMANRAGNQQSQRDIGSQQSDNQQSGSRQSGLQQDSGSQNIGNQQNVSSQSGRRQDAGNQQSGQRQNQQKGGQHASGGTPALDDLDASLDSKNKGSMGSALDQQDDWQDKQR